MTVWKNIEIPFDIPLKIVFDDSFSVFKYSIFSRRYHVYKDREQPSNPLWVMILCIVKKKKTTSTTST